MIALALGLGCGNARPTPASPIITTITSTAPTAAAASRAATGARTAGTGGATVAPGQARSPAARGSQAADACVEQAFQSMTREEQKIGQLFMVGLNSSDPQSQATAAAIQSNYVGNVVLYGAGWNGAALVKATTAWLQSLPAMGAVPAVRLFISGNQEGGEKGTFQAFYGPGFDDMPAAIEQGKRDPSVLQAQAAEWGKQLLAAGVNLDLAPVMDTVPPDNPAANAPIGAYRREFGMDVARVADHGAAFIAGMHDAGEAVSVKHFPGLGRVTGNTDFTAQGITDTQTTAEDEYLQPFAKGIAAGADFVMVSLARYTKIDAINQAVFSRSIVTDLLRKKLGFDRVIVTDDVGAAAAVAAFTPAQRALGFLRAGGDMVLTVQPSDIGPMTQAIVSEVATDAAFAAQIDDSVRRVLTAKARFRLLQGCAADDGASAVSEFAPAEAKTR